jgi:hypothetical protein
MAEVVPFEALVLDGVARIVEQVQREGWRAVACSAGGVTVGPPPAMTGTSTAESPKRAGGAWAVSSPGRIVKNSAAVVAATTASARNVIRHRIGSSPRRVRPNEAERESREVLR